MADRKFQPGMRPTQNRKYGTIPEDRVMWLETNIGQMSLVMKKHEDDDERAEFEPGPNLVLMLPTYRKYNLSGLTLEELETMRRFFNMAFDLAEPIARERDRIANERAEAGDDSMFRHYRDAPKFVTRERALDKYRESILFGSSDLPPGDGDS